MILLGLMVHLGTTPTGQEEIQTMTSTIQEHNHPRRSSKDVLLQTMVRDSGTTLDVSLKDNSLVSLKPSLQKVCKLFSVGSYSLPLAVCPKEWNFSPKSGKCYKFFTDWKTWDEARAYCLSVGINGVKALDSLFQLTLTDREHLHPLVERI